jgi:hypothetical protein
MPWISPGKDQPGKKWNNVVKSVKTERCLTHHLRVPREGPSRGPLCVCAHHSPLIPRDLPGVSRSRLGFLGATPGGHHLPPENPLPTGRLREWMFITLFISLLGLPGKYFFISWGFRIFVLIINNIKKITNGNCKKTKLSLDPGG